MLQLWLCEVPLASTPYARKKSVNDMASPNSAFIAADPAHRAITLEAEVPRVGFYFYHILMGKLTLSIGVQNYMNPSNDCQFPTYGSTMPQIPCSPSNYKSRRLELNVM